MKPSAFYMLLGATVIVTAGATVTAWQRAVATLGSVASETVVPGLINRVNDVASIEVVKGKDQVKIQRTADGWVMPDRGGYPVKFEVVKQNIVTMAELKTVEPKTAKADLYSRIEVEDPAGPDTKSGQMTFKDQDGKTIASMVIGRKRYAPIGGKDMVYVRKPGESRAWLAEGVFELRTPAPEWLVKEISGIKDDRWKTLTFTQPDGAKAVMVRKENPVESKDGPPDLWDVEGRPADRNLKPPATVGSTASAYSFLNLDDVSPAKEVEDGTAKASSEFLALDGLILRSRMVEKGDAVWTIFEAATTAEATQPVKDEAAELNKKLSGWAYKLPEYKQNFLSRKFDDLVEAPRKEEAPKTEGKSGG
ncbi:MAG: DUF4340 domain-containing protein [Alphaproteobacteria bacterium]|nr:DUF4340 domain-containing protein [Alphaproteobacteria bacterium]